MCFPHIFPVSFSKMITTIPLIHSILFHWVIYIHTYFVYNLVFVWLPRMQQRYYKAPIPLSIPHNDTVHWQSPREDIRSKGYPIYNCHVYRWVRNTESIRIWDRIGSQHPFAFCRKRLNETHVDPGWNKSFACPCKS
jgi:hypothetical protein